MEILAYKFLSKDNDCVPVAGIKWCIFLVTIVQILLGLAGLDGVVISDNVIVITNHCW